MTDPHAGGEEDCAPGVAAFLLDASAASAERIHDVCYLLELLGFELLGQQAFASPDALTELELYPARTPPFEGGTIIFGFDVFPRPVPAAMQRAEPRLDNARTEDAIVHYDRLRIAPDGARASLAGTLCSSDAWRLIDRCAPDRAPEWRSLVAARRAAVATGDDVVRNVSRFSRRAKVEIIRRDGALAVKKTFRHQALRFLERETRFLEQMSALRPEFLPVTERGDNYFISPFVEAEPLTRDLFGRKVPRLLALRHVRQIADVLRFLFARGYDPVDCAPHNLLIGRDGTLKVIDFEYIQHFPEPVKAEEAVCLSGVHSNFERDSPVLNKWAHDPYRGYWYGYTGLPLRSFLHDPAPVQALKRPLHRARFVAGKLAGRLAGGDRAAGIRSRRFLERARLHQARMPHAGDPPLKVCRA